VCRKQGQIAARSGLGNAKDGIVAYGWLVELLRREQAAMARRKPPADWAAYGQDTEAQDVAYAFYIPVPKVKDNGLPADSWANATQVFTVDKSRLAKHLGKVTPSQLRALVLALQAVLEI
jgi:hypothetical protein